MGLWAYGGTNLTRCVFPRWTPLQPELGERAHGITATSQMGWLRTWDEGGSEPGRIHLILDQFVPIDRRSGPNWTLARFNTPRTCLYSWLWLQRPPVASRRNMELQPEPALKGWLLSPLSYRNRLLFVFSSNCARLNKAFVTLVVQLCTRSKFTPEKNPFALMLINIPFISQWWYSEPAKINQLCNFMILHYDINHIKMSLLCSQNPFDSLFCSLPYILFPSWTISTK